MDKPCSRSIVQLNILMSCLKKQFVDSAEEYSFPLCIFKLPPIAEVLGENTAECVAFYDGLHVPS